MDPGFIWSFSVYPRARALTWVASFSESVVNLCIDIFVRLLGYYHIEMAEQLRDWNSEDYDAIVQHYRDGAISNQKAAELWPKDDEHYICKWMLCSQVV